MKTSCSFMHIWSDNRHIVRTVPLFWWSRPFWRVLSFSICLTPCDSRFGLFSTCPHRPRALVLFVFSSTTTTHNQLPERTDAVDVWESSATGGPAQQHGRRSRNGKMSLRVCDPSFFRARSFFFLALSCFFPCLYTVSSLVRSLMALYSVSIARKKSSSSLSFYRSSAKWFKVCQLASRNVPRHDMDNRVAR